MSLDLPVKHKHSDACSCERRVDLTAIPRTGTPISSLDLDITIDCNMRCVYCFKEKHQRDMQEKIAFDAIVWLIHASGPVRQLTIALMGGEPLMRFELIRKLVPFAKRRAGYHGKTIHFSATTNNTLVSEEIIEFWRRWGLGFHSSIDGIPEIQNRNRPLVGGHPSSDLAEKGIERILDYRGEVTARCTIVPDTAEHIVVNHKYFRSLGFRSIAMVPGCPGEWSDPDLAVLEQQFREVADLLIEDFRQGRYIYVKGIDEHVAAIACQQPRPTHACGAGRGMVLIDVDGNVWPCHRWNKESHAEWQIGSIYEGFSEEARSPLDVPSQMEQLEAECDDCLAKISCGGLCPAEALEETGNVYKSHSSSCKTQVIMTKIGQYVHDTLHAEGNEAFMKHYYPAQEETDEESQNGNGRTTD